MKNESKNTKNHYENSNKCIRCGAKSSIGDCYMCKLLIEYSETKNNYKGK